VSSRFLLAINGGENEIGKHQALTYSYAEPGKQELFITKLPGDRTRITIQSLFQSISDRDGMVQVGMDVDVNEGYERLDALLEGMQK